jgi:hypothetical protein
MLRLTSSAFIDDGAIPEQYTCEGIDISPPLHWENVPEEAQSLVVIIDDPDAPDPQAPKTTWVHWVLYNIPTNANELPENASAANLPHGAEQGLNDWNKVGYGGPCPPIGRHRYFHKLYALDKAIEGLHQASKKQIEAAMKGHIIAETHIVGTYQKGG